MRVEFTSIVAKLEVDQRLLDETGELNVHVGLEYLDTSEGTGRDQTCAVSRLGTPGDDNCLIVTNRGIWLWRCPEAKVLSKGEVKLIRMEI